MCCWPGWSKPGCSGPGASSAPAPPTSSPPYGNWTGGREVVKRREKQSEGGDGLPPGEARIASPYDTAARWSAKRDICWLGYKLHISETCAKPAPGATKIESLIKTREIRQGYLSWNPERAVRVRITDGQLAALTVKGPRDGARRPEFEYPVPLADAGEILARLCPQPLVEKVRHYLGAPYDGWTVDEFYGSNAGLVLAELDADDAQSVTDLPPWI